MIDTIIVIGKPGCGKSIMVWYLSSLLLEDGIEVHYISDRIELENGILADTRGAKKQTDGSKIGKHGKLIADGPPGHRKVHVLDGSILNHVHKSMIQNIKSKNPLLMSIMEYAIGPDIEFDSGKEPLRQSAAHLVQWVQEYHVTKRVFIIDVESTLAIREQRQYNRPDAMAIETFRAYFPDGGEMTKSDKITLRNHYYQFRNLEEDNDAYFSEVRYLYETRIAPRLFQRKINNANS